MRKSVFDFSNYKDYLHDYIRHQPSRGHGFRSQIAERLGCHVAYVSQVLNRGAHFSLEQAEDLNHLLGHGFEEAEYFLLLVQMGRAGSHNLKKRIQHQLDHLLEKRMNLKSRVDIKKQLTSEDQLLYYSSWHYAALHILVTIPEFQTLKSLSHALNLSSEKTETLLRDLERMSLIEAKNGRYLPGVNTVYLGNDSPTISKHHTNWRMKAISSLDHSTPQDLHFSVVVSLSEKDVGVIREQLAKTIEEFMKVVKASPEETLRSICIDLFKPTQD